MKTKLLSLLLFAVLLVTAIPVATAAESEPQAAQVETLDLHTLYVKEGLTSLFSALSDGAESVDLAGGTWRDRLTGAVARLGNAKYWEVREDGAVGFDILYGQAKKDGSVTLAADPLSPLVTDRYAPTDAYAETRLDIGLSLLPKEDFTVEYLARYNPIYVADENGGIAKNKNGSKMELFLATGKGTPDAQNAGPADHIGFLSSFATERDGVYASVLRDRGGVLWCLTDDPVPTWESPWIGLDSRGGGGMKGAFRSLDGIRTYAITRDETRKENGALTAVYALVRDGESFKKSLAVSTANKEAGRVYYDKDDVGAFYLSSQTPTDFYSVRIYDRLLTEEEVAHNRLVDLMLYYGMEIPVDVVNDEAKMKVILAAVKRVGFATDATARAATALDLQDTVDGESLRGDIVSLYAARESLTALFTASVFGTVDLKNGKWTDLVSGTEATLGVPTRWHRGKFGGIGYNTFCGELDAGGNFNPESAGNNYKDASARLSLSTSLLPKGDFTVDYLAMYKPVYLYDVRAADKIARDADGTPLETYDFDPEATGLHLEKTAIDQLGWFSSYESSCDGIGYKPWGGAPRGSVHWLFNCNSWYSGNNSNWLGKKWTASGGLNRLDDTLRQNDVVQTYSIILDETLTVKEDGTRVSTGLFSLYRDTHFYNSNANEDALNSTENGEGYLGYVDVDTPEKGGFWLSATHPTDFFCVRVYNRVLTEAELLHNRTADLLVYYGVEIPKALYANDAAMAKLGTLLAETPFATDATERAACRATVTAALDSLKTQVSVQMSGVEAGTLCAVDGRLVLPETVAGRTVLAFRVGASVYAPLTALTVTAETTLEAIPITLPSAIATPTAYVTNTQSELGLRFASSLAKTDYETLVSLYGEAGVHVGVLIAPVAYVEMANGVFTREALMKMVTAKGSASGAAFVGIVSRLDTSLAQMPVAGVLTDFRDTTCEKDPAFTAVAFIDIDANGDGVFERTLYGDFVGAGATTVTDAMTLARPSLPTVAQGWIDTLLLRFGA